MNKELEPALVNEYLRRIAAGDKEAFRTLYLLYYDRLYQFVRMHLNNADAAKDSVSELFYQFWKSRGSLPGIGNFNAYAYRAIRNSCMNSLRVSTRNLDYDLSHPKLQVSVDPSQSSADVLRHLPHGARQLQGVA